MCRWLSRKLLIHEWLWFKIVRNITPTSMQSKWAYLSYHMNHDDVIKWKHFPCYWPFVRGIHRSPVNSPHKGQWRGAFMFSLICAWINRWVNNREAGDLRRYRAHYDVIVMNDVNELLTLTKSTECMANASMPVNQFLYRKPLKLWNSPEENNLGHDLQSMLIPQNYYVHQQIMNAWLSFFRLYM